MFLIKLLNIWWSFIKFSNESKLLFVQFKFTNSFDAYSSRELQIFQISNVTCKIFHVCLIVIHKNLIQKLVLVVVAKINTKW